jgi:hypothetical protein
MPMEELPHKYTLANEEINDFMGTYLAIGKILQTARTGSDWKHIQTVTRKLEREARIVKRLLKGKSSRGFFSGGGSSRRKSKKYSRR